jgi:hypothetical protein
MKCALALLLLIVGNLGGLGSEPKVIAISDWSQPVDGCSGMEYGGRCTTLRGRLVILQGHFPGDASELPSTLVYVDFQNLGLSTAEIYFDPGHGNDFHAEKCNGLKCDLFDSQGKTVPQCGMAYSGGGLGQAWLTLVSDSTLRMPASYLGVRSPKEGGLILPFGDKQWFIQPNDTNTYYLSASFTVIPPTNHISEAVKQMRSVAWNGTLVFPKVKISLDKP